MYPKMEKTKTPAVKHVHVLTMHVIKASLNYNVKKEMRNVIAINFEHRKLHRFFDIIHKQAVSVVIS